MSYRHCTNRERSVEVSALSAHMWLDGAAEDFAACMELADRTVDALLDFADDWDNAAAAERGHEPARVLAKAPRVVLVESRTMPGTVYHVDIEGARCDCPAGRHGRTCWHLEAARKAA